MKHSTALDRSLVIAFAALLASAALAGPQGPQGKDDDGNSKRHTERNKIATVEKAWETDKLDIEFRGNSGTVKIKPDCEECPVKALRILATTKVFDDGREIPLARVATLDERRGVVLTKPGTDDVTRILAFKK